MYFSFFCLKWPLTFIVVFSSFLFTFWLFIMKTSIIIVTITSIVLSIVFEKSAALLIALCVVCVKWRLFKGPENQNIFPQKCTYLQIVPKPKTFCEHGHTHTHDRIRNILENYCIHEQHSVQYFNEIEAISF